MNVYLRTIVLIILAGLAVYFIPRSAVAPEQTGEEIVDFETCAEAGNPILESEPRLCQAPDGRMFVETDEVYREVVVDSPVFGELVTSPLLVSGRARGFWFFEGELPMVLKDEDGRILWQGNYMITSGQDWMTSEFVEFSLPISFPQPQTDFGVLIIQKNNPSDLRHLDASFAVPVRFR